MHQYYQYEKSAPSVWNSDQVKNYRVSTSIFVALELDNPTELK